MNNNNENFMTENNISSRYIEAFEYLDATTNGLAKILRISQRSVWNFVNKKTIPSESMVKRLCEVYPFISFEYIMNGEGSLLLPGEHTVNIVRNPINIRFNEAVDHIGLNCNSLAKEIGINQRTLYNYIKIDREPSYECIALLCKRYKDISFDYIMTGNGTLLNTKENEQQTENNIAMITSESNFEKANNAIETFELIEVYKDLIYALKGQVKLLESQNSKLEEEIEKLKMKIK